MKNKIFKLLVIFVFTYVNAFSVNELWRSRVSGSWTTPSTWEFSTDGGGVWIIASTTFPDVNSSNTTIRNPNAVTVNINTSLAIDQFRIEAGASLSLGSGSRLMINDGPGLDFSLSGSISGNGVVKVFGADAVFDILNNSTFNVPLTIDSGSVSIYNTNGPNIAELLGAISISAGRSLTVVGGGYTVRAWNTVTNKGTISGSNSNFIMRGSAFTNEGMINPTFFNFDTTTTLNGGGIWNPGILNINSSGNVFLNDTTTFGGSSGLNFNIFGPGIIYSTGMPFFIDGTLSFVNVIVQSNGSIGQSVSTSVRTKGNVNLNLRNGTLFKAALNVVSGTTSASNDAFPNNAKFYGTILIDSGADFHVANGGYFAESYSTVTNNGTISGSSSTFRCYGSSFTNNSLVNVTSFEFDSTTSLAGTGTWASNNVFINSPGIVSLANNLSFGSSIGMNFTINPGGTLNPNTRTFTFNGSAAVVNFILNSSGNVSNSGLLQTQGNVTMNLRTNSNFNVQCKTNTGTAHFFNDNFPNTAVLKNNLTVDAGSLFNIVGGGYFVKVFGNVTNNGTISGSSSGFTMKGNAFANNGTVNSTGFSFDSTTSVSGTGVWGSNNINLTNLSNVSLANNVTFGSSGTVNFVINPSGILNPNTFSAILDGSAAQVNFTAENSSTAFNSGKIQCKGSVAMNLRSGCNFNSALNTSTGVTTVLNSDFPYEAIFNNTITIDTGSVFNINGGGYFCRANENVINNGTISGSSSTFNFWSQNFTNNGLVNVSNFYFKGILFSPTYSHSIQGTGNFTTPNCVVEDGAFVIMSSNHQFSYITINNGGTLDINSKILKLYGAGSPIAVNGFLLTPGSTIEYNGISPQSLVTANIDYANVIINDSAGVSCLDNFTITGTLQITKGDLNLNGKIINLLTTGTLTETAGNTVSGNSGFLVATRNINAPSNLNVAGLGAQITTSANLGLTEIRRGSSVQTLPSGTQSISRYYTIKPVNNSALNATLIFKYDDSELNGNSETSLSLFKSTNAGTNYFFDGGTVNTTLNQITKTGISSFARYTAGSSSGIVNLTCLIQGYYNLSTLKLNMKDTLTVQLRNNHSPYNVIDSARSTLDSVTFTSSLRFDTAPTDTYYVVINQRNSIQTWSKSGGEIYTAGGILNYDFSNAQSKAFGNNMILVGTKWTDYSGDVNQDGSVDLTDISDIFNAASVFLTGYVTTDIDGNRIVDLTDVSLAFNNSNNFVAVVKP